MRYRDDDSKDDDAEDEESGDDFTSDDELGDTEKNFDPSDLPVVFLGTVIDQRLSQFHCEQRDALSVCGVSGSCGNVLVCATTDPRKN